MHTRISFFTVPDHVVPVFTVHVELIITVHVVSVLVVHVVTSPVAKVLVERAIAPATIIPIILFMYGYMEGYKY